ncbi:unnamed protein product [Microthlaspi erraticum]|uniref:Uncharacterized protein n=1 Tax=Microthlaspi erraticum TaxID=1685480 RepID=A0A6D2KMW9_9BRAS|nr:unnamed protein product [Microthlaspi erraticum]
MVIGDDGRRLDGIVISNSKRDQRLLLDPSSPLNPSAKKLIMISVVIIAELLVEYTAAIAKLTAGILPRRQGDGNVVRIGGFSLPSPSSTSRSSPFPDYSSHLVDF